MEIIIFGAPGVGKGTQAKILASKLNLAHISTGDILRSAIKNKTELGLKAKEIVESGGLVPDDLVAGIVKEVLNSNECSKGYILDGYPRTCDQAKMLYSIFNELNIVNPILIKLNAEDQIIIDRLSNRLVCKQCGNILNTSEITNNFKCPNCNSIDSYYKRADDDAEVVKKRLDVYHSTTAPVFEFFKDKSRIIEVDGTQDIDQVTLSIVSKL